MVRYNRERLGRWQRNIWDSMKDVLFAGAAVTSYIKIIRWLDRFVAQCNADGLPEVAAVDLAASFLAHPAKDQYLEGKGIITGDGANQVGFTTWPGAVNHLISLYLPEHVLQDALQKLRNVRMEEGETVRSYHVRLAKLSRDVPDVLSKAEIMSIFINGLEPTMRAEAQIERPRFENGPNALHHLVNFLTRKEELANSLVQRAQGETRTSARRSGHRARESLPPLSNPGGRGRAGRSTPGAQAAMINMAETGAQNEQWYSYADGDDNLSQSSGVDTYFTADASTIDDACDFAAIEGSRAMGVPLDTINVVTGHPAPFERPGRGKSTSTPQPRGQRTFPSSKQDGRATVPIICFVCYLYDHISRECPHRRCNHLPEWICWFHSNFDRLAKEHREYLKRINRAPSNAPPPKQPDSSPRATETSSPSPAMRPRITPTPSSPPPPQPPRGGGGGSATQQVRFAEPAMQVEFETPARSEN